MLLCSCCQGCEPQVISKEIVSFQLDVSSEIPPSQPGKLYQTLSSIVEDKEQGFVSRT